MSWKEAAAELGDGRAVSGFKALEGTLKNRDFKRLVATTAAQIVAMHPGIKKGRRAAGPRR